MQTGRARAPVASRSMIRVSSRGSLPWLSIMKVSADFRGAILFTAAMAFDGVPPKPVVCANERTPCQYASCVVGGRSGSVLVLVRVCVWAQPPGGRRVLGGGLMPKHFIPRGVTLSPWGLSHSSPRGTWCHTTH
jgi:hypothetical protein